MTCRRGFALLAALWLVAVLTSLVFAGGRAVGLALAMAENRMATTRAAWAARGCLAAVLSRSPQMGGAGPLHVTALDSLALGVNVWCGVVTRDPSARINPNTADSAGLARALGSTTLAASILDWMDPDTDPRDGGAETEWYRHHRRPTPRNGAILDVRELAGIRGFDTWTLAQLDDVFTTWGDGTISPNTAPPHVLRSVGLIGDAGVDVLTSLRGAGKQFHEVSEVIRLAGLEPSLPTYQALTARLNPVPSYTVIRATGYSRVRETLAMSEITALLSVGSDGIRIREMEIR